MLPLAKDHKFRARTAATQSVPEYLHVDTVMRPFRVAVLANRDLDGELEDQLVQVLTTLWGGRYSLLLPLTGTDLAPPDERSLSAFSPDLIVDWSSGAREGYLDELQSTTGSLGLGRYDQTQIESLYVSRHHPLGGVPMGPVAEQIAREERPSNPSNLRIVKATGAPGLLRALKFFTGNLPDHYAQFYQQTLHAELLEYELHGLTSYLEALDGLRRHATPISLTTHYGVSAEWGVTNLSGLVLVMTSQSCSFDDASLFWNLRTQTGFFGSPRPYLIPWPRMDDLEILASWIAQRGTAQNYITLASRTIPQSDLVDLRDRLHDVLPQAIECIDIWYDNFYMGPVRTISKLIASQEVRVQERRTDLVIHAPSFADAEGHWITAIRRPPTRIDDPFDDFQWPVFPGINRLIGPKLFGGAHVGITHYPHYVRLDQGEIDLFSSNRSRRVEISIPQPSAMAKAFFKGYGIEARIPERSRYVSQLLRLVGGPRAVDNILKPHAIGLFEHMLRGRTFTANECVSLMKLEKRLVYELLHDFTQKRLLLRGYRLACPVCDLQTWYPLADIDERFTCAGCLNSLELPLEPQLTYKINTLVARATEQGALGVLGGIKLLTALKRETLTFQPGIELTKPSRVDVDLLASVDRAVCAMECKSLLSGANQKLIQETMEQMSNIHEALRGTSIAVIFLYVLSPTVPDELTSAFEALSLSLPQSVPLVLVSKADENRLRRKGLSIFLSNDHGSSQGWASEGGNKKRSFL